MNAKRNSRESKQPHFCCDTFQSTVEASCIHINLEPEIHFTFLIVVLSGHAWYSRINRWATIHWTQEMVNNFFIGKSELALVLTPGPSIRNVIVQFMNWIVLFASVCCSVCWRQWASNRDKANIGRICGYTDLTIHLVMYSFTSLSGERSGNLIRSLAWGLSRKARLVFRIEKEDKKHNCFEAMIRLLKW